jgi:CO/xanthine dehydrogenase FAD-binding subunit
VAAVVGGAPAHESFAVAAEIVREAVDPPADIHATTAYRRHLAAVLTRRGLAAASDKIGVPA